LISAEDLRALQLRIEGRSFREIAKDLDCGKSTIFNIMKKFKKHGQIENIRRSGRPKKLNPRAERGLVHMTLQDPLLTSLKLAGFLNFSCTKEDEISASLIR
jgi:transposase